MGLSLPSRKPSAVDRLGLLLLSAGLSRACSWPLYAGLTTDPPRPPWRTVRKVTLPLSPDRSSRCSNLHRLLGRCPPFLPPSPPPDLQPHPPLATTVPVRRRWNRPRSFSFFEYRVGSRLIVRHGIALLSNAFFDIRSPGSDNIATGPTDRPTDRPLDHSTTRPLLRDPHEMLVELTRDR
jgi:hypothetical protein